MKKNYILDTSVLLHDPESVGFFEDNDVYIDGRVLEEIDRKKKGWDNVNRAARAITRSLDQYTSEHGVDERGIPLPGGGRLFFLLKPIPKKYQKLKDQVGEVGGADDTIIQRGAQLRDQSELETIVVSKDGNLRIRARAVNLKAEDYEADIITKDLGDFFQPVREIVVPDEVIGRLYKREEGRAELSEEFMQQFSGPLHYNEQLLIKGVTKGSVLARNMDGIVREIVYKKGSIANINPRNMEQRFFADLLLDPSVSINTALAEAGTGKTLLALAAGVHQRNFYDKVVIVRPIVEIGRGLGYLPGDVDEKIEPFFAPVYSALKKIGDLEMVEYEDLPEYIEFRPMNHMKGDTIENTFLIVDEAQDITPKEAKRIMTRMGNGSKLVMVGDPYQTDNPFVNELSNGLTYVTSRLRGQEPEFGTVCLFDQERSRIAQIGNEYL